MNENVEKGPPKINLKQMDWMIKRAEFSLVDLKHSHLLVTKFTRELRQSVRWKNCLCLPTTHVRSFRCQHHQNSSLPRGGTIGTNLSASVTHSKLSCSLFHTGIKPMAQLFYIHNSPIFYYENVLTCEFLSSSNQFSP